jgi:hypothetical protein
MKVLIPLISRNELNEEFLDKAVKGSNEVLLLLVIDKDNSLKASDISSSTHFLEEVKKAIGKKRKKCEDFTEWGETKTKIKNTALLNKVDKIALLKQENLFFEELVNELKKEKQLRNRIHVISVEPKKQEAKEGKESIEGKESENKELKQIKSVADKILEKGFKSLDSIKKIRFKE